MPSDKSGRRGVRHSWQRAVLFPFLFPVFYVLHIARYYFGAVPASDTLEISGAYLLATAIVYFLVSKIVKDKLARGLTTLILMAVFICWYKIINPLFRAFHVGENYNYYPFILLGIAVIIWIVYFATRRLKPSTSSAVLYYLNALFTIFVAVELGFIGFYAVQRPYKNSLILKAPAEQHIDLSAKAGPNIYLLLFDEYASTEVLKDEWHYDNSDMDSFLKDRGFFVNAKSRSNYCWTEFSMASLLHMDFFNRFRGEHNYVNYQDIQRSIVAIEHPRVTEVLRHAGYTIKCHSFFEVDDQPADYVPELRINKGLLVTVNSLFHGFQITYLPYLKYRSQIKRNPNFRFPPFYRMDDYNNEGVSMVFNEARYQATTSRFVYAHFLMPHDTYFYDSVDRIMPMDRIKAISKEQEPQHYMYNLRHTNNKIRQMVDTILKHDPHPVIIVLGDHGYRYHLYEDDKHPEYFKNMSAIYFPDRDYSTVPDSFTNVNVFRIVLNKVCGTNYPLLPDKSYTLSLKRGN
jgi:hypothetical protein